MLKSVCFIVLSSVFISTASAQVAKLGNPTLSGSGCPQGSVSVALTEDASTISVLFSSFTATYAHASSPRTNFLTLNCRIKIPIQVPPGYAMDLMKLEYRGFYAVPNRFSTFILETKALTVSKYITSPPQITKVAGPVATNYQIVHNLSRPLRSVCGREFELDFTINMGVQGRLGKGWVNPLEGDAMISLDSLDAGGSDDGAGAYLGVALKPCTK